jgi:large subunit ribosomal protein L5
MNRLKQKYQQELQDKLMAQLKLSNKMAVPTVKKIVLNTGISKPEDVRERKKAIDNVSQQFAIITGQKPQMTVAKKAISEFSLQQGEPLGIKVTLRGERMWQFLDKLISIVLPRVKDFRGVSRTAFDGQGNYSLGLEEQIVFPEINYDEIESVRGLQINIITSTKEDEQAYQLLELLGMPFEKEEPVIKQ